MFLRLNGVTESRRIPDLRYNGVYVCVIIEFRDKELKNNIGLNEVADVNPCHRESKIAGVKPLADLQ